MDSYPSGITGAYRFQSEQTLSWQRVPEQRKIDLQERNESILLFQKTLSVPLSSPLSVSACRVTLCGQLWHPALPVWTDTSDLLPYLTTIQRWLDEQRSPQSALQELDGDFIITYLIPSRTECFLYRHITGMRGLYYRLSPKKCQWATSILDLFKDSPSATDVNPAMLAVTTASAYPKPGDTVYRDIQYLPAGTGLHLYADGTHQQFSTRFTFREELSLSFQEASEAYSSLLANALQRKIRPFRSLGVLLSGGLDSSIITYEAQKICPHVHGLHWTWDFPVFSDERACAAAVCDALHIPSHLVDGTNSLLPGGDLVRCMQHVSLPFSHSFYQSFAASAEIAHHHGLSALLSGHLGDLLLQGDMLDACIAPVVQKKTFSAWMATIRNLLNCYSRQEAFSHFFSLLRKKKCATPESFPERLSTSREWLTLSAFRQVQLYGNYNYSDYVQGLSGSTSQAYVNLLREINNNTSLDTTLIDHVFHPYGIHLIHPYADKRLIEFCLSLPSFYRRGFAEGRPITKVLARYAYREKLPFPLIQREVRTPYGAVDQHYCEQNQVEVAEIFSKHSCLAQSGIIDPLALERIIQDTTALRQHSGPLVAASSVELWLRSLSGLPLLPAREPVVYDKPFSAAGDFAPRPSAIGKVPSNVVVRTIGTTLLLLNISTQEVVQLNADAAQVFRLICMYKEENDILTEAQGIWQDIAKEDLQVQIREVLTQLQQQKWIAMEGVGPASLL